MNISRIIISILLSLLLARSLVAAPLPQGQKMTRLPGTSDQLLYHDSGPGWYWPDLMVSGSSRWWVNFQVPDSIRLLDMRLATFGGVGTSVTLVVREGSTERLSWEVTPTGYLDDGFEIFPLPEEVTIGANTEFSLEVVYPDGAGTGPPWLTADYDGNGQGYSFFNDGGITTAVLDHDLCIRTAIEWLGGGDPLPPVIQLPVDPVVAVEDDSVHFLARVTDPSGVNNVELSLIRRSSGIGGSSDTLLYSLSGDTSMTDLWSVTVPVADLPATGYELTRFVRADDVFGNEAYSETQPVVPGGSGTVSTAAGFFDQLVAPDNQTWQRTMQAVRLPLDLPDITEFQPDSLALFASLSRPVDLFLVAENYGQPDFQNAAAGEFAYLDSVRIIPDQSDPGWYQVALADSLVLYPGNPVWIVVRHEQAAPGERLNALGADQSGTHQLSWTFDFNRLQFVQMEQDLLFRLSGSSFDCESMILSELSESFENDNFSICWNAEGHGDSSPGWSTGTTSTEYFLPPAGFDGSRYAYLNSDEYRDAIMQDTLFTPWLHIEGIQRLSFLSYLVLEALDQLSSARVIYQLQSTGFAAVDTVMVEAGDWSSSGYFLSGGEWQLQVIETASVLPDTIRYGFVYAANNPPDGCYGWAIDSVVVEPMTTQAWRRTSLPDNFYLLDPAPNPFNGVSWLTFHLTREEELTIQIYNVRGGRVRTLAAERFSSGTHRLRWQPDDRVASGLYIVQYSTEHYRYQQKLLYIR